MVQLRLYTYDGNGREIKTPFTFDPLKVRQPRDYDREATRSATRRLNRRAFARQDVREITIPAGFLMTDANKRNLMRLYDAHKIEWLRSVGGKLLWVEYDLDVEGVITPELVEDFDPLERHTIKLVQSKATWFTDFENKAQEVSDAS